MKLILTLRVLMTFPGSLVRCIKSCGSCDSWAAEAHGLCLFSATLPLLGLEKSKKYSGACLPFHVLFCYITCFSQSYNINEQENSVGTSHWLNWLASVNFLLFVQNKNEIAVKKKAQLLHNKTVDDLWNITARPGPTVQVTNGICMVYWLKVLVLLVIPGAPSKLTIRWIAVFPP